MKALLKAILLILALHAPWPTLASSVSIMVSDNPKAKCPKPKSKEHQQFVLTSKETSEALDRYFREESNPALYDAAIVNAQIKFCGEAETRKIFETILQHLERRNPDRRTIEVYAQFDNHKLMRKLALEKYNASGGGVSPEFISNIRAAQAYASKARGR